MRIVHGLAQVDTETVDGSSNSVRTLAAGQAAIGHEVCVLTWHAVDASTRVRSDVRLVSCSDVGALRGLRRWADVLHAHSVFSPRLAWVQAMFGRAVPVVASPQGGLDAAVLRRRWLRKSVYSRLVERPLLRRSDLIVALSDAEAHQVGRFLGSSAGPPVVVLPAPIGMDARPRARLRNRVVYLGRFDVEHKGLDRLVDSARYSTAEFHLYGHAGRQHGRVAAELFASAPANVVVHGPLFGVAKDEVLGSAALYVQSSRWEAFGRSTAEAAMAGTPVVLSSESVLAGAVAEHGCGIVLDFDDPARAGRQMDALLDPAADRRWAAMSASARAWAVGSFSVDEVASRHIAAYEQVMAGRSRRP
jgi:glycosyltransferase involved in cell wall biosynthesis